MTQPRKRGPGRPPLRDPITWHLQLPRELAAAVDKHVGRYQRAAWVRGLIAEALEREARERSEE